MESESLITIAVEGAQIVCRAIGKGPPLLVLNGYAATTGIHLSFIDSRRAANSILVNNRGIGGSTDDGQSFDIGKLADDAAHVIETLGFERANVLGWSMGGYIAQTLAMEHPDRVEKLILLATDPGGSDADLASPVMWSRLDRHFWHAAGASTSGAVAAFPYRHR